MEELVSSLIRAMDTQLKMIAGLSDRLEILRGAVDCMTIRFFAIRPTAPPGRGQGAEKN